MDFDDSVADQVIDACVELIWLLDEQRGPRASVTGEALDEFRGPFAVVFRLNSAAHFTARNILIGALENLTRQVRFAKTQAEHARQKMKYEQAKAAWHLAQGGFLAVGAEYVRARVLGLDFSGWLSESEVRRPEVLLAPMVFEAHEWAASGGAGTSSAVPDALKRAASMFFDQDDAAERECQRVVRALGQFQASCSWALSDVDAFAPAVSQFGKDDREDAGHLWRIAEAFRTAGQSSNLTVPVELSTTSLALAISPERVSGENLLKFLATASPLELEVASENPEWAKPLASAPLEQVAKWWAGLKGTGPRAGLDASNGYSVQQEVLLGSAPKVFGSLDGIPALDRVYANELAVVSDIDSAESELTMLRKVAIDDPMAYRTEGRREFLVKEIGYLKNVQSGDVQLYLHDREKSRVVEMIGTPGSETERVISYIPGTFTSLKSFYDGGVQQISKRMVRWAPDTVAFVYKDGLFPGEDPSAGEQDLGRLGEANNPERGLAAGRKLASFQLGVHSDPFLQGTERIGIGHSWGYQNLTSSEIFGARYAKSVSLSGAGMHEQWVPDADTGYSNYVYGSDALLWAQLTGEVWDGKVPITHESFTNHGYNRPNHGSILPDGNPIEDHSLPTIDTQDNWEALRDLHKDVTR